MRVPASAIVSLLVIGIFCLALSASRTSAADPKPQANPKDAPAKKPAPPKKDGAKGKPAATGLEVGENRATPINRLKVAKDFKAELLYSVPSSEQGSWVNLCVDDKGRIITSDQFGGLYRFTPPAANQPLEASKIEKLSTKIRAANGLLWAFGALYVGVNDYEGKIPCGLYRISSSNHDDNLDKVELLRELNAKGDHGVHAVLLTPDGKDLFLICGDGTKPTAISADSPVPQIWGEDHLLPRMPDGKGFMRDVMGPGGTIYRVSPDGKKFEMFATGFRNIFDAALNSDGELFTYDADMEYDFNTSWYRPTRVCHAVSGAEFGWRNGAGKRPEFYEDNLPATLNVGPGSPTGMVFGYGAKFPAKYQRAMFSLDWSWGKLYAIHLQPSGSTYTATKEEFLSGTPLPLTDVIIHPADGAMYFTIGGRKVQSGLYRVTYTGKESTAPISMAPVKDPARETRHQLEAFHGKQDPQAVAAAWPHLGDTDRFIRWAARTAIEFQPPATWSEKALTETNPAKQVEALLALARATGVCPQHRTEKSPPVDTAMGAKLIDALLKIKWESLDHQQQLTLVRTLEITMNRFGRPEDATVAKLLTKFDPLFPAADRELNWELCETLVYLQSPTVAAKGVALIEKAATQEEQIEYARSLRMLKAGWTTETRTAFFEWLLKAANYRGGASFERFISFIHDDAIATLTPAEKTTLAALLAKKPEQKSVIESVGAAFVGRKPHTWKLEELAPLAEKNLRSRDFANGRKMFGAAACFTCHRFGNEGGMTGPDITTAAARYSPHDLLDKVLNPSKQINDQFATIVVTTVDGDRYTGVVVNLNGDTVMLNTDPAQPNLQKSIDRKEVQSIEQSKVSPMPTGLLNVMTQDEILDLVAYVLSGGSAENEMFRK